MTHTTRPPRALVALTVLAVLGLAGSLAFGMFVAGADIRQGDVQRIFPTHIASFFGGFLGFLVTVFAGVQYLRTRQPRWDSLALAGVEVGMALSLVNLFTGMIWARPIWNTWWTWDPRLTAEAVMVLTYAAYLMLRAGIDNVEQRRRFAAVYGIVAIVTVFINLFIIRIVPSTIHPVVIGPSVQNSAIGAFDVRATPGVQAALVLAMLAWGLLIPVVLIWWRVRLQSLAERVQSRRSHILSES